jgi:hypothetical protein
MDELNTHCLSGFYEAFGPADERGLTARHEIHYTSKHGSWLKVAEIEQLVLARQALGRRAPDRKSMDKLTTAWARRRNRAEGTVDWRFTTADARIKRKRLYPKIDN